MDDSKAQSECDIKEKRARYIVGIDLGTTNIALSFADLFADDPAATLTDMPILQTVASGECASKPLLPSCLYLPTDEEKSADLCLLPWGNPDVLVGEFARSRGASVPDRFVSSAKSWLCHDGVDRTVPILPWGAPKDVEKLSPVDVSARYLTHLANLWNASFQDDPINRQEVVLTVPASFDQVARQLTLEAAKRAGISNLTLIEEPLAAFYDWTRCHRGHLEKSLGENRLILIVDVGGGTTDLTLISAQPSEENGPKLRRLSVGKHLLLGGDNMDTAIARLVESKIGERLDSTRWAGLLMASKAAKEKLLSDFGPEEATITVTSRGSKLMGGTKSVTLKKKDLRNFILEGFFPLISPKDRPGKRSRMGLQEAGLPYETDPAITKHVASFLSDHASEVDPRLNFVVPDAVLLNGGIFASEAISARLLEAIDAWRSPQANKRVNLLSNDALDLAVSRGAVAYGLVRKGLGLRIGGGSPRAYFVGVNTQDNSSQKHGVCIVPRHLEEDREVQIPRVFQLLLNSPVSFPLYASNLAIHAKPGDDVAVDQESFVALPPIRTVLKTDVSADSKSPKKNAPEIPVHLKARLTEIGTLELWCESIPQDGVIETKTRSEPQRWRLEFGLRETTFDKSANSHQVSSGDVVPMPKNFSAAKERIEIIYGKKPAPIDKRDVKNLGRELEKILGPKVNWPTPVIRELWGELYAGMGKRRRTADHERMWCALVGFTLRPGFGDHLDEWRASETFRAFEQGLQFQKEPHNWEAWWIMWRRIAGGLNAKQQQAIFEATFKHVRMNGRNSKSKEMDGLPELIRLLASLERLASKDKAALKVALFSRIKSEGLAPHLLWSLGRLLARIPLYAGAQACMDSTDAEEAIDLLLEMARGQKAKSPELCHALAQIARMSADRSRDISEKSRAQVLQFLQSAHSSEDVIRPILECVHPSQRDEEKLFGDSLPPGLRLHG